MAIRRIVRLALVLAVVGIHVFSATAPSVDAATQKRLAKQSVLKAGLKWVRSQQNEDGSFPNPLAASEVNPVPGTVATTASVVSLLIALGNDGLDVETEAAVAYLEQTDPAVWDETEAILFGHGRIAGVVMALVGAGSDPRDVGGDDLIARLEGSWDEDAGLYGRFLGESALVAIALASADAPIEERAIDSILTGQLDDGSWAFDGGTEPGSGDAGTTAVMVQALVALERADDEVIAGAVDYFRTVQLDGKEFAPTPDFIPDPNTTGLVISALIAAGEDLKAEEWAGAVAGLLEYQNESGGFRTSRDGDPTEDLSSTISALTALAGAYMPVLPAT